MFHFQAIKKKKKKKKRVSTDNWISERNRSFDFFANFWETRGLKRSRVRRRGFCKARFSRRCCCRTPLLLLLLLLLLGLALTNTFVKPLLFFSISSFGFHPMWISDGNLNWDGEWEDFVFIFTLYPNMVMWSSEKTYGLKLWTNGHKASFQPFTQVI